MLLHENGLSQSQKILHYIATIFIILTFLGQFYTSIYQVIHFNILLWLAPYGDLAHQTELLLINAGFPFKPLNSAPIDYGSELFILGYLFKILTKVFSITDPVYGYYFLTLIHIIAGIAGIILLRAILPSNVWPVCVIILSLTPLWCRNLNNVKPDPNVVFFLIVVAMYYLKRYREVGYNRHLLFSIAFAAFATAVKWWGVFLLPIIYLSYYKKAQKGTHHLVTRRQFAFYFMSLVVLIISISFFAIRWLLLVIHERNYTALMNSLQLKLFFILKSLLVAKNFVLFSVTLLFIAVLFLVFINYIFKLYSHIRIINHLKIFIEILSIFCVFLFLFDFPFLISTEFLRSLNYFALRLSIANPILYYGSSTHTNSIISSILLWLKAMWHYKMLNISIIALIFTGFVLYRRHKKDKAFNNDIHGIAVCFSFIMTSLILLMCFVERSPDSLHALLYPFFIIPILWVFVCFRYNKLIIFLFIALLTTMLIEQNYRVNVLKYYLARRDLRQQIHNIERQVIPLVQDKKRIILCQRDFPLLPDRIKQYKDISIVYLDQYQCRSQGFMEDFLLKGDILLVPQWQYNDYLSNIIRFLIKNKKIEPSSIINGVYYGPYNLKKKFIGYSYNVL